MHRHRLTILCAVFAFVGVAVFAADQLSVTPREGVVLLTNGELLTGTIIPAGDRYDVHLASGEICLRKSEVALICRDAAECYRHKRAGIEAGRVQDHLALAEWCIRNNLLDLAERELADARRADATHPKIRLVESRLELAKQPEPSDATTAIERPVSHTPLDNMARNLPPGTMESFTHSIQPLLLNNCSKSGCHGSRADGGLKLERIHPRFSGRTATQRNLEQVLALIDRENPPASKLLQAPIRPHGNVKVPIFTDRQQSQYRQLVQWAYAVAGARSPVEKPTLEERTAPLLQTIPGATGVLPASAVGTADPVVDVIEDVPLDSSDSELPPATDPTNAQPTSPPSAGEAPQASSSGPVQAAQPGRAQGTQPGQAPVTQSRGLDANGELLLVPGEAPRGPQGRVSNTKVQRGAQLPVGFTPKDEFDPEIFNRRFFGR